MALALQEYLDNPDFRGSHARSRTDANLEETAVLQASGDDGPSPNSVPTNRNNTVTAKAYLSVDKLPPGGTCRFVVYVSIKDGWHINTNEVGEDWQVPTELTIASKQGVTVSRLSYSPGKSAQLPGMQRPLTVYEKTAEIRGVLAVPAEAAGKPEELQIQLKYQACNAKGECLPPSKVKLKGKMQIAPNLQSVHAQNPNLFSKLPAASR
jgi:DsbC/DsbD-like thiol-disulfide interchange protein